VVVVRDRFPTWAAIFAILLVLVAVAILVFVISGGRGTVLVVAIPGFPLESIMIGLALGLLWVLLKRRSAKSARVTKRPVHSELHESDNISTRWKYV
jgi:amino acid transporter